MRDKPTPKSANRRLTPKTVVLTEEAAEHGQLAAEGTPVVGIGASAGGLDAFKLLLAHLPADTGFAVVLVQHLDPKHHSMLSEILGRATQMPVTEAADGRAVEANHVYVIPPNTGLTIVNRELKLTPRATAGPHLPINQFLKSLARDYGSNAIGVILSGAGMDGSAGLQAVKEAGGITFAQDPDTAEFSSMPKFAAAATCVDFVLSPQRIAAELVRIARHPFFAPTREVKAGRVPDDQFRSIFSVMHEATGIDFSLYREKTVHRRILRRLALRSIGSIEEYTRELENDAGERSALQRDLLISVTSFFRDPESFEALKKLVFPEIVQSRPVGTPIRIWVPGCASGEEAYSIAISLQEYLKDGGDTFPVQIFASDISEAAIEKARSGKYLENIVADVGADRLNRYFTQHHDGYQIGKALREMCVFSRHNLIDDPPFSKLDLISCRNVLIYLRTVQKNIIPLFHYALKQNGFLMLGRSETASFDDLFSIIDSDHRIYAKRGTTRKLHPFYARAGSHPGAEAGEKAAKAPTSELWDGVDVGKEVDRVLLSRYSPAGVVVDEDLEVIEIRGQTTPYVQLPTGKLSFKLLALIPETGLFLEVEKLVHQVKKSGEAARRDRLQYERDGAIGEINVEVMPLDGRQRRAFLVIFEPVQSASERPAESAAGHGRDGPVDTRDHQIAKLKQELADARQRLLFVFEEHQTSQEESQNATEEALSTNEELQSLNEELDTAKEELQSTNEELITVNQELQSKNTALARASHFTMSIVETVREPLLVLDTDFRVRSANHSFYRAFRVSPDETEGQLLYSFCGGGWNIPGLRDLLDRVLPGNNSFQDFQIEQDFPGLGHRVLVLSGCRLDGLKMILLAIDDVTERKDAEKALSKAEEHLRQAQKMEAIGRLAGGIAHDFNNLLTAILGYTGLLLESMSDDVAIGQAQEIKSAGDRAASLTQQLLAFSRRQVLQPKILDLNTIVADLDRMLRHLVGEQIQLAVDTTRDLWRVRADPGEIGRAVMNLCLNARDAMPGGGTLTIHTANVTLEDTESSEQNLGAGRHVLLAIGDTGVGIDSEVKAHIFEPFFTTKEVGKGTGLGLATVIGIVEQSGGAIRCDSELGQGTTFKIFLPAVAQGSETAEQARGGLAQAPKGSSEVVLLVEDEDIVRRLARTILETSGYVILEARDGREGLSLCEAHDGAINLLISDVMMPGLGGRELVERAAIIRPHMKVLFMSGHTPDVMLKEGIQKGVPFLQKPFRPTDLAHKVREVLDSRAGCAAYTA